jgi:two-component system sensor histidine kinase/response regulator
VDVADNGQIAVDMVQASNYDLVFMDMQMPVMDGVTATVEIRKHERFRELPVVAMTANAMQADRDRCIAAGMNDHLGKPIEPEELWQAVLKWVRLREGMETQPSIEQASVSRPVPETPPNPELNVPGLNRDEGLRRIGGNHALYLSMLRKFIAGNRTVCAQIREALRTDDWKTSERLAHTVKGVAGNLGAFHVHSEASKLESLLRERQAAAEVDRQLATLGSTLEHLLTALEEALPSDSETQTLAQPDWEQVRAVCARLDSLLAQSDADVADVMNENADLIRAAFPHHYGRINDAVQEFDFDMALTLLQDARRSSAVAAS